MYILYPLNIFIHVLYTKRRTRTDVQINMYMYILIQHDCICAKICMYVRTCAQASIYLYVYYTYMHTYIHANNTYKIMRAPICVRVDD